MKKIRTIAILLFSIIMISGCSCTSSMCNKEDLANIKNSITEKYSKDEAYKQELRDKAISQDIVNEEEIQKYIDQNIQKKIENEYNNHPKACLTTEELKDPDSGATITGKTWKSAFKEGLLEGLIVYPISWLLITFSSLFGGSGGGKILSIIVTTIIIKCLMLIFTLKSQIQNQKLQSIQAEIAEISNQFRDKILSDSERTRLSMKMMEIYNKNGINPLASLIPTLVSFPIFISVWAAVSQTLVIRTGTFLGIELGASVSNQVFSFNIGAIILFLLMSGLQILSMKLPTIIRKRQLSSKNNSREIKKDVNNQATMMLNVMMAMILLTGFMLPAALAVYWSVGAVFSIIQTIVFQNPKVKEKLYSLGNRKKKAKVVQ